MSDQASSITTPLTYFKVLFRRKALFIIPVFIGLILGICTGIILPKKYRSSTVLLVEEGKTDNPLFNQIAVSTTVTQRLTAIKESMLGWNNLVQLVTRLKLDKNVKTIEEFENLVLEIRRNIAIQLKGKNVIELTYVDDNPEETQAVVKNITDIFIERNIEQQNQETSDAIVFIENMLKVYRGKIKSTEIAKLQDQLNSLLIDSTESHPLVKQLREQIRVKKAELEKENLIYTENDLLTSVTSNPIIDEIKKSLDVIESKTGDSPLPTAQDQVAKAMLLDKLDNVMARDVDVNASIYNMLLQRLETAKITQRLQSSKEGTKYTVLDPPRIPRKPFYPNKFLVTLMGIFFGCMVGAGLVVVMEFFDRSFIDVEEAKEYLGVPLLGAISKITTEDSLRIERERETWLYVLMLVAGSIIVLVTLTATNLMNK
ncbi:MAG: Wzz/FepE/Etk N-terminal domain-containing protein [Candidatus Omnitrophica bacterium]|nr:Wzz/FepE/Etk N-terminal domain-containing protein [Candidatus Omnitrophota bacterium]